MGVYFLNCHVLDGRLDSGFDVLLKSFYLFDFMPKIWQLYPPADSNFLSSPSGFSPAFSQLLYNRGLRNPEEIKAFLEAEDAPLFDPFLLRDMTAAVDLIINHIKAGNKIIVYGDYDADGVTAAAVLSDTLRLLKAKVEVYLPDRVSEGYGLNKAAVKQIADQGAKLIITVDTGIRNHAEIREAQAYGLEVIVTDHHTLPEEKDEYPPCLVIDPADLTEKYPFHFLAGVGVAFKLASAIISKAKLTDIQKDYLLERNLDLVAIGTIADMVSLLGENRVLVKKGLSVLNNSRRVGLKELIKIAKLDPAKKIESWNVGFQLGPRLNAASRMGRANNAFSLLVAEKEAAAIELARELNEKNSLRQKLTEEAVSEVEKQIQEQFAAGKKYFVSAVSSKEKIWSEGIVGLVAGKICERYYLPTLIITLTEDGYKGSGRSIEEFNLIGAIEEAAQSAEGMVDKYGGHPMACGFSLIGEDNLQKFLSKMNEIAERELVGKPLEPKLKIETELTFADLNERFLNELNLLAPFGQNNPQPKLLTSNLRIAEVSCLGVDKQHIKFRLEDEDENSFWAISFGGAESYKDFMVDDFVDVVYFAEWNEWNGRKEIQLKIIDLKNI